MMNDLISRQAAIDAFWKLDAEIRPSAIDKILNMLKGLPSAQPDLCDGCDRYGASCVGEGCGKLEMPEVAKDTNVPINDTISRQSAIDAVNNIMPTKEGFLEPSEVLCELMQLPSARPEPLSDAYTKAVWTWLLDYQIKTAELKGRYTPYEVLSWVANDWRKEHEGFD